MSRIDLNNKEVWTIEDFHEYSEYEITYINRLCSERSVPHYTPENGRRVFFKRIEAIEWLTANKVKTKQEINNPDRYKNK